MRLSFVLLLAAGTPAQPLARKLRTAVRIGAGLGAAASLLLSGCASAPGSGYGPAFLRPSSAAARQAAGAGTGPGAAVDADATAAASVVDTAANYQALIRRMQGRGLWYASLAHVDALELRWGANDDSRLLRADALLQTDQPDAAEPLYHALLASPMAPAAYRGLARVAAARGMPLETVRMFDQARRRMPTDAALLSDLGYAMLQAGQVERARIPLLQAAQLQADAPDAAPRIFSNLAVYLLLAGKPDEARALAERRGLAPEVRQAIVQQARALDRSAADGSGTVAQEASDAATRAWDAAAPRTAAAPAAAPDSPSPAPSGPAPAPASSAAPGPSPTRGAER